MTASFRRHLEREGGAPRVMVALPPSPRCAPSNRPPRSRSTMRTAAGAPFAQVDDVFAYTDIPVGLWDRIRDRGVTL